MGTVGTFNTLTISDTITGGGTNTRKSVRAATTAAGTLATSFEAGDVIDGVTLVAADRILLKDQASGVENGIYIVAASGAPARASDFAAGDNARSIFVFVEEGTVNADRGYICTDNRSSDNIGTDPLTFVRFDGSAMTVQDVYDASTSPEMVLDSTRGALTIRDNATPIGANLFEVQNNGGGSTFFSVDVSGATIGGDALITGNLTVNGTTITISSENLIVEDNYITMNNGYTADAPQTGGLVINYDPDPTSKQDTVDTGGFTAGVASTSNPTVITVGSGTFATSDIILISDANDTTNNGLFEVLSHTGTTLTVRGVGLTARVEDFTRNQFTTDATVAGTITLTSVSVIRSGLDGVWETGEGQTTPITYVNLVDLTATQTMTNKTLTSPRIGTSVLDTNGNELLLLTATGSAVNELTLANAATGANPSIAASGGDADVGIDLITKGTGVFTFSAGDTSTSAELRLEDNTGGQYIAITLPATVTTRTHTLPDTTNDTFAMLAATQTLTNKTITASTNSVTARFLGTTGSDVDIDSTAPTATGQTLVTTSTTTATWQTITAPFGTEFEEFSSLTLSSTSVQHPTWTNKISVTTASKPIGTYRVSYVFDWSNDASRDIMAQVLFDGTAEAQLRKMRNNAGGTDTDPLAMGSGAGTDQREKASGFFYVTTVSAATHAIILRFAQGPVGSGGGVVSVSDARVDIWRVA